MRVSFLDGKGLAAKLPELIASCESLDIAMAYVKLGALVPLLSSFEELLSKRGSLRMVFGLSSRLGITDKAAAEMLLELGRRENVSVHKNNNPGFHPKLFIFGGKSPALAVGSANLTKGAQTSNAEANVLLEEVDPPLMEDASNFFLDCFKASPPLRQRHINKYREKETGHGKRKNGFGEGLDPLPRFNERMGELSGIQPRELWKISPGEDAWCWDEWYNEIDDLGNGVIAIGWDVGPLVRFRSPKSLADAVAAYKAKRRRKFYVKPTADQLWAFKDLPKREGTTVIVYSEGRVFGIARITPKSTYVHKGIRSVSYAHQVNVNYLWFAEWPKEVNRFLKKELGKRGTLFRVENPRVWNEVIASVRANETTRTRLLQTFESASSDRQAGSSNGFPYGYVFPHTQDGLPDGPVKELEKAAKAPEGYWHHGETARCSEDGFKFVIGFNKMVHGEFQAKQRLPSDDPRWKWRYVPKAGTFYLYDPPRDSRELVNNYFRRESFTTDDYARFASKTKLVKLY